MKKVVLTVLLALTFAAPAFTQDGGAVGNLQPRQVLPAPARNPPAETAISAENAATAKFVNAHLPPDSMPIPPYSVVESYTITDRGTSETFVLLDISGRGYSNTLFVYRHPNAEKAGPQVIDGWKMGNLRAMVRDLDGDGFAELIVYQTISGNGVWEPLMAEPAWPSDYRLQGGKYIESSQDFQSFYDHEVLPQLDKVIAEMEVRAAEDRAYRDAAARDTLEKDKILRVLGRNPNAGLQEAYQWMKSDDPELLQCAIATFADIGGHEEELKSAQQSLPAARKRELEARNNG